MSKRKPRRIVNPLLLIAGVQKLHQRDAMAFVSQFDSALWALEHGQGTSDVIRRMTLFIAALYDASRHYGAKNVEKLIDQTGDLWIRAGERCAAHGMTERIAINAEERAALTQLHAAMAVFLPEVQVGPWKCFVEAAQKRWDDHVADSVFRHHQEQSA